MGAVGKGAGGEGSTSTEKGNFSWDEFGKTHTNQEISDEFTRRNNITVDSGVTYGLTKAALIEMAKSVEELVPKFEADFGFTPIYRITDKVTSSTGYASAGWYSGNAELNSFVINLSKTKVNKDVKFLREAIAHEFGHLTAAYLAYSTMDKQDALKALRDTANYVDKSEVASYNGWNTAFAKDIVLKAIQDTPDYKTASQILEEETKSRGKRLRTSKKEQMAINSVMESNVRKYATYSYHEAIADCVAYEYVGKGNSITNAVCKELQNRVKQIKKGGK